MTIKRFEILFLILMVLGIAAVLYFRHPPSEPQTPVNTRKEEPTHREEPIPEKLPEAIPKTPEAIPATPEAIQLKKWPTFTPYQVDVPPKEDFKVGFLGETSGDGIESEGYNADVVERLFEIFKASSVKAVFMGGNLVSGLIQETPKKGDIAEKSPKADQATLAKQLKNFISLYRKVLGPAVPLFPVPGDHETQLASGSQIFRNLFDLDRSITFEDNTFAYTVVLGEALFVLVPTDIYDGTSQHSDPAFNQEMLNWLDGVLKSAASKYRFRFVIGHEPAFTLTSTFSAARVAQGQAFWQILANNHVSAYFSSNEHVFDRTNYRGVWQIISGGGGALRREGGGQAHIFHCLVLVIPADKDKHPKVQVIDVDGYLIDQFELSPIPAMLYKRHIS